MELATLIAALIAAAAALIAARRSSATAETIQSREHERRDHERQVETCDELHALFIDAIRGSELETSSNEARPPNWWEQSMLILVDVAKGCHERAAKAGHIAAKIGIFCDEEVAGAADAAVEAVSQYGFAIMYAVATQDSDDRDSANAAMVKAGEAYQVSVVKFQNAARQAR
jgi:hypothetical protein